MFASVRIVFEINLKIRVRGKNSNVDCRCKNEYVKPAASLGRKGREREIRIEGTEQDEERGKLHVRYHVRNSAKFDLRNWLPN